MTSSETSEEAEVEIEGSPITVLIIDCNGKDSATLNVNGQKLKLKNGQEVEVRGHFQDALENSGITSELVASEKDVDVYANILDGTIAEIADAITGLNEAELNELLTNEESGKTRKGVVEAISGALKTL